jgi:hypothetical protein
MIYNNKVIQHKIEEFTRENIESRKEKYEFNNLGRIEIFLWDLEIFIQLQNILGDKIVLKGGAAAQFYLPIENQRTSVDIDIIVEAKEKDILSAINKIESDFNGQDRFLKFRPHKPKIPKTNLPLKTYFIDIPSVISEDGIQQIKCEFIFLDEVYINKITSPKLFSCDTKLTYNILPLNVLIGDKLTTIGPNTIGIQDDRSDEQIKQVYDLIELIEQNLDKIDTEQIKEYYQNRANKEAIGREIKYDFNTFIDDAINFIERYRFLDINKNRELEKQINDFQGLYLAKRVRRTNANWVNVSRKISLFLNIIKSKDPNIEFFRRAIEISNSLLFQSYTGKEKSEKINYIKNMMIENFNKYTSVTAGILKGKTPLRIFWEILSLENLELIVGTIDKELLK